MSASLFDSHCHLEDERFTGEVDDVLGRMSAAHVDRAILAGSDMDSCSRIVDLLTKHPNLYAVLGVHPQEAESYSAAVLDQLAKWLALPQVVGIGEIGLDYHYEQPARALQRDVFAAQLDFAHEHEVPAVLHIRDAHGDTLDLLRSRRAILPSGVMHCFSGSVETAREYLDLGFNISLSGSSTFKNARNLHEVARFVPLDRLMIETDSPYLAPVPMRGQRSEPTYVRYVADWIAQLRDIPVEELIHHTTANTERLYKIPSFCKPE